MTVRPMAWVAGLSFAGLVHAQEQFGLLHSNYAGTDAVALDPARMATQWQWMDVNVVGADLHVWNDHVYVTTRQRTIIGQMRESIRTSDGTGFTINESLASGRRSAFINARVAGPAVVLNLGRSSIGAHISTRAAISATGVGEDLARFGYHGLHYWPQHGIRYQDDGLRLLGAAWTEIGVSYARLLAAHDFSLLSAGITAKYLVAHAGGGLVLHTLDYAILDTLQAQVQAASGTYGLAGPAVDAGRGLGLDLGITYERTLDEADGYIPHQSGGGCTPLNYRYRLGVSLIDLGGMRFRNAYAGDFDASAALYTDYPGLHPNGTEGIDSLLSHSLSGFVRSGAFSMGLPTAVAVQYDQRILAHVYVAGDLVQNLSVFNGMRLRRPNTVAVVPRFETQRLELAVPVVFHEYDYRHPTVGVMLRLNNVIIGSDNALPFVSHVPAYGADLYCRIKWTIFRSPVCRGKRKPKHHAGDGNALPCAFNE